MALSPDIIQIVTQAAQDNGVDPALLLRIANIESGGDPNNRTGSYRGLFQLGSDEFKQYGSGDIYDPTANANAAAKKIAAESSQFEKTYGRPATATDIYLIHNQGAGGYAAHLANPDAPAWQNMAGTAEGRRRGADWAKDAIAGNYYGPGNAEALTGRDFVDYWRGRLEGQPQTAARANELALIYNVGNPAPANPLPQPVAPPQPPAPNAPPSQSPLPSGIVADVSRETSGGLLSPYGNIPQQNGILGGNEFPSGNRIRFPVPPGLARLAARINPYG
jgi:hypothetical protein